MTSGSPTSSSESFMPSMTSGLSDPTFAIRGSSASHSKYVKSGNQFVVLPNGGDNAALVVSRENVASFHFVPEGNLVSKDRYTSTTMGAG